MTSGTDREYGVLPMMRVMGSRRVERLLDLVPLVLSAAVGAITVERAASGVRLTTIPLPLWVALLVVFASTLALTTIWVERLSEPTARGVFVGCQISAIALILTAPSAGWMAMITIYTALVSAYLLPRWGSALVVASNTAAILGGVALHAAAYPAGLSISIVTAGIYFVLQLSAVLFVWLYQRQIELRTSLEVANVSLHATRELLAASTRARERTRIARDLHDVLGHQLTALALELEVASHTAGPRATPHINRARHIAKTMLSEVRETVGALRDRGESVEQALSRITAGITKPRIELSVDATAIRSPEVMTAVTLGVQEVVTNAIRHAHAQTLWIDVRTDEDAVVVLEAKDDGIVRGPVVEGNGLTGLRERFESLGGSVRFTVANGFGVTARAPT